MNLQLSPRLSLLVPVLLVLFALAIPGTGKAQESPLQSLQAEQRRIFARVAPSVVFLLQGDGVGSGFFVSSQGDILTNAHVVGSLDRLWVVLHDGRRVRGTVVERSETMDLALVKVELQDTPTLSLAPMDNVEVGDWVAAVGHGRGAIWSYTTGMISNIYPDGEERPVFQTQIPLNPGSSGGPVVNLHGEVIGVVVGGFVDAQAINFAIPVEQAISHLPALSERCDCLVLELPDGVPIYVNGALAGTGPRVVLMAEAGEYELVSVIDGRPRRETIRWPETRHVNWRTP